MTFRPPNWTMAPNELFDDLLPLMKTAAEIKVVWIVCRHTVGWGKHEEELTFSKLQELTGLARDSVNQGIQRAMDRGAIVQRKVGEPGHERAFYALAISGSDSEPQAEIGGSEVEPLGGPEVEPPPDTRAQETAVKKIGKKTPPAPKGEQDKWDKGIALVKDELEAEGSAFAFSSWIEPLSLTEVVAGTVIVDGPDRVLGWVKERYLTVLTAGLAKGGFGADVVVRLREPEGDVVAAARRLRRQSRARAHLEART